MSKAKRDRLDEKELMAAAERPLLQPGLPYQFIMTYGWVVVAFYVRHETPLTIRVAHCSYYQNAGKTHAQLAREGGAAAWRYEGNTTLTTHHILRVVEYHGEVPRGIVHG